MVLADWPMVAGIFGAYRVDAIRALDTPGVLDMQREVADRTAFDRPQAAELKHRYVRRPSGGSQRKPDDLRECRGYLLTGRKLNRYS